MICPKCSKILPISKIAAPTGEAIVCAYCGEVVPSEKIAWKDGLFHFRIIGEVRKMKIPPRVLLDKQTSKKLDVKIILQRAKDVIRKEPNLNAICQEFMIDDADINFELIPEENK